MSDTLVRLIPFPKMLLYSVEACNRLEIVMPVHIYVYTFIKISAKYSMLLPYRKKTTKESATSMLSVKRNEILELSTM